MRLKSFPHNRPVPFQLEAETGGIGVQSQQRPRLMAQWSTGKDGKLACQWIAA
ncbi:MAG: hypothetical protein AAGH78_00530 [Cyanobacteria bacterium P01_H01_bin.58]